MVYRIDMHVHCRDGKQDYKDTIAKVLKLASEQGVQKICDMPNTDPPVLTRNEVEDRLMLVPPGREGDYFLYVGATQNPAQLEEAVRCVDRYPEVVGIKMFAGKSVGDLEIPEPEGQRMVYRELAKLGYTGPVMVHCEKESCLRPKKWNPEEPFTHCLARPENAETESIFDQVSLIEDEMFQGHLHICHVSCSESVDIVHYAKNKRGLSVSCGATPHHLMWEMGRMNEDNGLLYKMNPPLRDKKSVLSLLVRAKHGMIDCIETDHARHAIREKLFPPYMSGHPSLELYRMCVEEFLPVIGVSQETIEEMTHTAPVRILQGKV